jgi:phosphinothricin acetyltransferase
MAGRPDAGAPAAPPVRFLVRPAVTADAAPIAAIWNAVIALPHVTFTTEERTADGIAALIARRSAAGWPFLVAEGAGRVQGFASYAPFREGPGYRRTMEHTINLAPDARGRGVGRAPVSELLAAASRGGVRSLVAAISGLNPAAIAFHRRLGFVEVGRVPDAGWKGGRFIDLVLMQRFVATTA